MPYWSAVAGVSVTVVPATVTRALVATLNVSTVLLSDVFLMTIVPDVPLVTVSLNVITSAEGGRIRVALSAGETAVSSGAVVSITMAGARLPL